MAQMIDSYNDTLSFGNHNEDCAQSRIRSTNQSLAPCIHTEDTDSDQRFTSTLNRSAAYIDLASFQFGDMPSAQLQKSLQLARIFLPHLAKAVEISSPHNSRVGEMIALERIVLSVLATVTIAVAMVK